MNLDQRTRDIIRRIAECEPGLATANQVSWEVGGEVLDDRRDVRRVISRLVRDHVMDRYWVRHRDEPLEVIDVRREPLVALLEAQP